MKCIIDKYKYLYFVKLQLIGLCMELTFNYCYYLQQVLFIMLFTYPTY